MSFNAAHRSNAVRKSASVGMRPRLTSSESPRTASDGPSTMRPGRRPPPPRRQSWRSVSTPWSLAARVAPDYDGKGKAWVHFDDGEDAIVGGSGVKR